VDIYLSFAGALVEALLPKGKNALARWFALAWLCSACCMPLRLCSRMGQAAL